VLTPAVRTSIIGSGFANARSADPAAQESTVPFECLPTAIGSFPHTEPAEACRCVLKHLPACPVWPQLPNRTYRENMYAQFAEGLPGIVIDQDKGQTYFDTDQDLSGPLTEFYSAVLETAPDRLAITPEAAFGFYLMLGMLPETEDGDAYVKGQVTGPVSLGLTVCDQQGKSALYHDTLVDVVVNALALKARFQVRRLRRSQRKVIMFIDEPYLASYGSAFIPMERFQVTKALEKVVRAIRGEHAVPGIHCCGNTDWSILLEPSTEIISFDAFNFFQGLTLYTDQLKAYLEKGGALAWGIVPTSAEHLQESTAAGIVDMMRKQLKELAQKGLKKDALLEAAIITPSCGAGTLNEKLAERALELTRKVAIRLK
jgi:methionine synthase II (cobalamin-independent)